MRNDSGIQQFLYYVGRYKAIFLRILMLPFNELRCGGCPYAGYATVGLKNRVSHTEAFVTGTPESLLYDTFGTHVLTVDGPDQVRYRSAFRQAFAKRRVRETLADDIQASIDTLIDSFVEDGSTD